MVRCKAHNLETENACVGSIPTPATYFIVDKESYFKEFWFPNNTFLIIT